MHSLNGGTAHILLTHVVAPRATRPRAHPHAPRFFPSPEALSSLALRVRAWTTLLTVGCVGGCLRVMWQPHPVTPSERVQADPKRDLPHHRHQPRRWRVGAPRCNRWARGRHLSTPNRSQRVRVVCVVLCILRSCALHVPCVFHATCVCAVHLACACTLEVYCCRCRCCCCCCLWWCVCVVCVRGVCAWCVCAWGGGGLDIVP